MINRLDLRRNLRIHSTSIESPQADQKIFDKNEESRIAYCQNESIASGITDSPSRPDKSIKHLDQTCIISMGTSITNCSVCCKQSNHCQEHLAQC
jgi:hypothetical protein